MLTQQEFNQKKHIVFRKLNKIFPKINSTVMKAFECASSLQQEYVSRCLLHEKYSLTDDIYFESYILPFMKIFSAIPDNLLVPGKKMLDVGCGEGRMLLLLKAFGVDCYGIDKETFAGRNLQGNLRGPLLKEMFEQKGVEIKTLDIERETLPYQNYYFDFIIFQEVIEHLHNSPKMMLDEIKRVLRPGGYVIVSTPNHASLGKRLNLLRGRSNHWDLKRYYNYEFVSPPNHEYIGHTREFTLRELAQMLEWAGFRIEKKETFNVYPPLKFKGLIANWVNCKGTGLGLLTSQLLRNIYPDMDDYCLIIARS